MFHRNMLILYFAVFSAAIFGSFASILAEAFNSLGSLGSNLFQCWILLPIFMCIVILSVGSFLFLMILSLITNVKTGKPPMKDLHIIYKFEISNIHTQSSIFKTHRLFPFKDFIQICYERNFAPFGIAYGVEVPSLLDDDTTSVCDKNGYKTFKARAVPNAVYISCPTLPWFSFFGVWLILKIIYPKLYQYSKRNKLSAYPVVEIYRRYSVMLMAPLSQQDNFVVPEAEPYVLRSCSKLEESFAVANDVTSSVKRSHSQAELSLRDSLDGINLNTRYSMLSNIGLANGCVKPESLLLDEMNLELRYQILYNDVANNNSIESEQLKNSTPKIGNGHTKQG